MSTSHRARRTALTIVVGYDGSPASRAAVSWAIRRAGCSGRVILVNAGRRHSGLLDRPSFEVWIRDRCAFGHALIDELILERDDVAAATAAWLASSWTTPTDPSCSCRRTVRSTPCPGRAWPTPELRNADDFIHETDSSPSPTATFAGTLQYREYGFATRLIMRLLMRRGGHPTDSSHDYDYTDWDAVERFAHDCASVMVAGAADQGRAATVARSPVAMPERERARTAAASASGHSAV